MSILTLFSPKQKPIKAKSTSELVEEIHETFYTEVDRLLKEANIKLDESPRDEMLLNKAERLKSLGFGASKTVSIAKEDEYAIRKAKSENENKEHLKRAIQYFSFKYPQYKFITEDSVKKICKKYNLIYGSVNRYIGDVPDKNLADIENNSVKDEDKVYLYKDVTKWGFGSPIETIKEVSIDRYRKFIDKHGGDSNWDRNGGSARFKSIGLAPLEIAAPRKDFNMSDHEVKDFKLSKIEIPDPVVLQPVFFEDRKHYLVITAWGDEASDELVVNERSN